MDVKAIWLRTDPVPEADLLPGVDPSEQPQILRVCVMIDGNWRVAIEYKIEPTGQLISHIAEGHALDRKPIDPVTGGC